MRKPKQRRPHNDLSRSLTPLNLNHTLIAVIELSLKSWLVAGIVPGVERPAFEEARSRRGRTIELDRSMAEGSEQGRLQD